MLAFAEADGCTGRGQDKELAVRFGINSVANGRVLQAESLETVPSSAAERNLRDLVRINRWFGGHRALLQVFQKLVHPLDRFSVLDVGAASGDMGRRILESYKNALVVSLDHRIAHLRSAPPPRVVAEAPALPFSDRSFDFVLCSLLLHHFSDRRAAALVGELLRFSRRALIILDLERHPVSYSFLPLTSWLFRWSELTVHDGCISVAASFKPNELRAIAEQAGVKETVIRRHWPWFRISVVMPSSPNGRRENGCNSCSRD
jgi:SAM-dependent methyltransferase